jgi:hypothetical protein
MVYKYVSGLILTLLLVIPSGRVVVKVESVVPDEDSSVLIGSVIGKVGSVVVIISPGVGVSVRLVVSGCVLGVSVRLVVSGVWFVSGVSLVSDVISPSVVVDNIASVVVVVGEVVMGTVELVEFVLEDEDVNVLGFVDELVDAADGTVVRIASVEK